MVEKRTMLEPTDAERLHLAAALLRTPAQRELLGNYFYENNRVGYSSTTRPSTSSTSSTAKLFGARPARGSR